MNRDHASNKMENKNRHPKLSFDLQIHVRAHVPILTHMNMHHIACIERSYTGTQKCLKIRELSNIKGYLINQKCFWKSSG